MSWLIGGYAVSAFIGIMIARGWQAAEFVRSPPHYEWQRDDSMGAMIAFGAFWPITLTVLALRWSWQNTVGRAERIAASRAQRRLDSERERAHVLATPLEQLTDEYARRAERGRKP